MASWGTRRCKVRQVDGQGSSRLSPGLALLLSREAHAPLPPPPSAVHFAAQQLNPRGLWRTQNTCRLKLSTCPNLDSLSVFPTRESLYPIVKSQSWESIYVSPFPFITIFYCFPSTHHRPFIHSSTNPPIYPSLIHPSTHPYIHPSILHPCLNQGWFSEVNV